MWSAGLKSPLREERNRSVREFDQATEPAGSKLTEDTVRVSRVLLLLSVAVLCLSLIPRSLMAADADGVMMQNGKMMMMKEGKVMGPMQNDMTMSDGTKMMTDGTIMIRMEQR